MVVSFFQKGFSVFRDTKGVHNTRVFEYVGGEEGVQFSKSFAYVLNEIPGFSIEFTMQLHLLWFVLVKETIIHIITHSSQREKNVFRGT